MSQPKFTPGPWKVDDIAWSENERTHISISAPNGPCAGGSMIFDEASVEAITEEELTANAHLIAAAPEMYEALNQATKALEVANYHLLAAGGNRMSEVERRIELAKAAIAKAEGRQS